MERFSFKKNPKVRGGGAVSLPPVSKKESLPAVVKSGTAR